MKKKVTIIIGVVILAVAGFLIFKKKPALASKIETVSIGQMVSSISTSGEIKADKDATLQFQTGGLLTWVGVKEGESVRRGQAIASLDSRQLKKQLQKYLNTYSSQRDDFEQTQADYKQIRDNLLLTDAIKRILDKTQNSLNNSVIDVELTDLSLQLATIHSPFDGLIVSASTPYPGVNILATGAVFRIVDPKSLYFQAQVDETDVARIKVGQKVTIKLDAFPDKSFEGIVDRIDFVSTISSGGGTAYNIKVSLPDLKESFRVGMNGDAEVIQATIEDALLVPLSSLVETDGKVWVWKVENGKARKAEIQVGISNNDFIQVVSGISENDKIFTSNLGLLKEGMPVRQ